MTLPNAATASTPDTASELPAVSADASKTKGKRRRRVLAWTLGGIATVLAAAGAGGYAYASHYEDLALPGTSINGIDISGKSHDEIVTLLDERVEQTTVNISGDVTAEPTLSDLGTEIDTEATATAALESNADIVNRFRALLPSNTQEIALVSSTDNEAVQEYVDSLIPEDQAVPVNAEVTLNEETSTFEISPAVEGSSVSTEALAAAAEEATTALSSVEIEMQYEEVIPDITDEDAQAVADEANTLVAQEISVTSEDLSSVYTADQATKASWIKVKTTKSSELKLSVDDEAISTWVSTQAENESSDPITGKRNINESGEVVATSVEAVDGQEVTNTSDLASELTAAFESDSGFTGAFVMKTVEATWTETVIADGAEDLAYPAAPGEKWVDVDLSSKTVTAYEGADVVSGPTSIVDGAAATPTVTGTFAVYLKYESQTMRGENADGTEYETEDVPWVSYFHGGYALHGAPWRSSFGYSGSHGCINMPVSTAKWYYDWATIGTVVVTHY